MVKGRVPCGCGCGCRSTRDPSAETCWSCSTGSHAPDAATRSRLEAGADQWARELAARTPDSSSGISRKQLGLAAEAWQRRMLADEQEGRKEP